MFHISWPLLISNNVIDIDECMMEDICDEFVSCTVTEGAHECQCTLGDGLNCINSEFRGQFCCIIIIIIKKYNDFSTG